MQSRLFVLANGDKGLYWIEKPDGKSGKGKCPYYPCHHFEGQDCTYCFCPLYPCEDPELGEWISAAKAIRSGRARTAGCCIIKRPQGT